MYKPWSSLFLQGKWHKKLHPCSLAVHRCDSAIGVQLDSAERTQHHQPTSIWARGHGFIAYQASYESASRLNLFMQNIGHRTWHWASSTLNIRPSCAKGQICLHYYWTWRSKTDQIRLPMYWTFIDICRGPAATLVSLIYGAPIES